MDGYSIVDLVEKGRGCRKCGGVHNGGGLFWKTRWVGNKGLNPNGSGERWPAYQARCSRSFFVNGNLADARAYDAYCHNLEGIMSCICDGNPGNWPRDNSYLVYTKNISDFDTMYIANLHVFERFRLADQWNGMGAYASLGNGNCGSSPFPAYGPPRHRRTLSRRLRLLRT